VSKNIIIFSDGTGQVGGITFDEIRTNVYKLYRACRVAPDSSIARRDPQPAQRGRPDHPGQAGRRGTQRAPGASG
jgi:Uncharacterized alpha/beta hydrolase domain (DUF2235)